MTSYEDGINAAHQAMDFRKQERTLKKVTESKSAWSGTVDSLQSFAKHIF